MKSKENINNYQRILILLMALLIFPIYNVSSNFLFHSKIEKSIKKEFSISEIENESLIFENFETEFESDFFTTYQSLELSFLKFVFKFQNLFNLKSFLKSTTSLYDLFCCLKIDYSSIL